jgi:hypothetical protein
MSLSPGAGAQQRTHMVLLVDLISEWGRQMQMSQINKICIRWWK